ncbi:MAG TPA: plasmid stabilization protein [Flavobacteriaceae bacterium]|nr:plasmid stabilization protein [Flavobacteriaceae bacterium]
MNMVYKVSISPIAKANIREAITYYKENATLKVAQSFLKDYEINVEMIRQNPFYNVYYKKFRGKPMKKFPYIIFYTLDEQQKIILINAVFNTHRNPTKYPK